MSQGLPHSQVQAQLPDWRVISNSVNATFTTGDFNTGTKFVTQIAQLADAADHHPDVTLRYGTVAVQIFSHDINALSQRDIDLAGQIRQLAQESGIAVNTAAPQLLDIAIDALDIAAVRPFWRAVLAYEEDGEGNLSDPRGTGSPVWFQQMDSERPQRNRIHFDVWVPHDQAGQRVKAAVAAGGRLVSDDEAPSFWVLADPEGNEACVCTWQDRD